jgi:hypothetical protein
MRVLSMRHDRGVPDLVSQSLERLRAAGVRLDSGLSDQEVSRVQDRLGFAFGPEHRELLQTALPVGDPSWPDWRNGSTEDLRGRLDWPIDSAVFDVHNNAFWPSSWGARPDGRAERERRARTHLARVPLLVPIFSHRYLTVDPEYRPSPVFSVYQTDVIYYGDNLLDYVAHEFKVPPLDPSPDRIHVPFWSELAEGAEDQDL